MFEDVSLPSKPNLEKALDNLNYFFAFIFALEFVLKIIGLGMVGYFSSFWNCLDSLIVAVSFSLSFLYSLTPSKPGRDEMAADPARVDFEPKDYFSYISVFPHISLFLQISVPLLVLITFCSILALS